MIIDDKLISRLAELSMLSFSDSEALKHDLEKILAAMERLCELDTDDIPECSHPFDNVNAFRDDLIAASFARELIVKNAPNNELVFTPKSAGER